MLNVLKEPSRLFPLLLVLLFLAAFLIRATVSHELSPLGMSTLPQLDARENLVWAQSLAAGDSRWPSPPNHGPVYPYLLAGLLKVSGGSLAAARMAQAALAGATAVLLALAGARLFGLRAGLAAGVLLAFSGPAAFVDVALWEEVLLLFFASGALLTLVAGRSLAASALAGILLGLASASRPTMLLFALAAAAAVALDRTRPRRGAAAGVLLLAAGLTLAPVVVAVSRASGRFLFVRSYGAINLYLGNDPAGGGVQSARPNGAWDRVVSAPYREGKTPREEERYFLAKTLERASADPAGVVRVILSKAAWLTQAEEPRDNHSFAFFRERSMLLRVLPGFGLVAALSAVGLFHAFRHRLPSALPLAFLAAGALPALVALVGLRYRMPMLPAAALFGGLGASLLFETARERGLRGAAPLALASALVLGASHLRTHPPSHVLAEELSLEGKSLSDLGRAAEAEESFRKAALADPRSGLPWELLAQLRMKEGRTGEAREHLLKSIALDPDSQTAYYTLGQAEEALHHPAAAMEANRRAVAIAPRFFPARYQLGRLLLAEGDAAGAARELERVVDLAPGDADPLLLLAQARGAEGRRAEALVMARKGAELEPGRAEAWLLLGTLAADAGDLPTLREALDRARPLAGEGAPPLLLLVARRQRLEGDPRGALETLGALLIAHPESKLAAETLLATARDVGRERQAAAWLETLRHQ
ncbi:MAG: glycosyltransferase family 39 protein [Thermoanaerobaculia bacterium]